MSTLKAKDQSASVYEELDKGINDLENGNVVAHEDAMEIIRERISSYGV